MYWLSQPGNEPIGPMDQNAVIQHLRTQGGIGNWLICKDGSTTWTPVNQVPKIVAEFPVHAAVTPESAAAPPATQVASNSSGVAVWIHLSLYAGIIVPYAGMIVPIALWLSNRQNPQTEMHGKEVANWLIFLTIGLIVSVVLSSIIIGLIPLIILALMSLICPIFGAIKASRGEPYRYPMFFRVIK